ncbi:GSCFA family protein [Pontibacter ummariensis]|uniref:GSCFA family protein n=1 Tax=Pontibacter ummariensis TaxID=1610492 RepID=A0A239KWB5_9BACT|nr:GSCFA domain-containing protein [Pontibacter ummariensis]PRY04961.1 GSCFA family protein [Pontibacter ummariensis]SNT22032.1 GSCFA family protein [Pontibacter ummariensis]
MFRTEVHVPKSDLNLTLQDKVVTLGSCFADVIGSKLRQHKVEALVNPFGTIFNPVSVCLLLKAASGKPYSFEQHLVEQQGIWYAYDLHSSLSSPHKQELLQQIQARLNKTSEQLQQSSLLIITLGTAVAYRLNYNGKVVANCHKLPSSNFSRVLLSVEETMQAFEDMYGFLKLMNPNLKVLLTVSPVRHIKETIPMNSVSKATLRVLCHQLAEAHEDVLYFPAYEIMLDDLRDYRFYKEDMLHPTEVAEDYIWQKFVEAYYRKDFQQFIKEWEKIKRAVAHRPFHPQSAAHQAFLRKTLEQLQALEQQHQIEASAERQALQQQLLQR